MPLKMEDFLSFNFRQYEIYHGNFPRSIFSLVLFLYLFHSIIFSKFFVKLKTNSHQLITKLTKFSVQNGST